MSEIADGRLNVVLVEDHVAVLKGVERMLRQEGHSVIGRADHAQVGFDLIVRRRPDVAIVDLALPDGTGAELTERVLADAPDLGVVIYTGVEDREVLVNALHCGARGFVLKAGSADELLTAVDEVGHGGSYVDPRLNPIILDRDTTERISILTPREREILHLVAQGLTGEAIAKRLFIAPETVRTHLRNSSTKLEARTRAHAIAIALRQGEITSN